MKYVLIIIGIVVAIPVLIYIVGGLLPLSHLATMSNYFDVSNKRMLDTITDIKSYPEWRSNLEKVELLSDSTESLRWREYYSNNDPLTFKVITHDSSKLLAKIDDNDLPFSGTWTYQLNETRNGTQLTITEDGEIYNPFYRFVSKFIMGHDTTIKQYLSDLKKNFEKAT